MIMNSATDIRRAISHVYRIRYGETETLKYIIGSPAFDILVKRGLIYQGKEYPDVWRITDKGIKRGRALKSKVFRKIAVILWKFGLLC